MMVLNGYTFMKDQPWLQDHKMLMSLSVSQHSNISKPGILDINWALQTVIQMTTLPNNGNTGPEARDINTINHSDTLG